MHARRADPDAPARPALVAAAVVGAAGVLVVQAASVVVRRPSIGWTGDRALTELAVRQAARWHQLVGMGGRFGWRHPGPLWLYLLLPSYAVGGRAPWALTVGVLAIHIACAAVVVVVAGRAAGARGAVLAGALIAGYLRLTGYRYWTNVWAGYAFTWPMLALVVVAAAGTASERRGWALPAAAIFGTLLVQTDVSTIVPVAIVGVVAIVLRLIRAGPRRLLDHTSIIPIVLIALAWAPPVIQQYTEHPGNITLLARFGRQGAGGYPLRVAVATVGASLSVVPGGARWVLEPGVQAHIGRGDAWAVAVTLYSLSALAAVAVVAHIRDRLFARDLAILSAAAVVAAVIAIARVDGPINYYLLTWISILPLAGLLAAGLALLPSRLGVIDLVALLVAALITVDLVATQGTAQDYDRRGSGTVVAMSAAVKDEVAVSGASVVRLHIVTSDTWPDAAGVGLQLQRAGARLEVDKQWVFLFGDAFKPSETATLELWFARPNELPIVRAIPQLTDLGLFDGVDVRIRAAPASTSGT